MLLVICVNDIEVIVVSVGTESCSLVLYTLSNLEILEELIDGRRHRGY